MVIPLAFLIDILIRDPLGPLHPVAAIGKLILVIEKGLRRLVKTDFGERLAGIILTILVVGITFLSVRIVVGAVRFFSPLIGFFVSAIFISLAICPSGLNRSARQISKALATGEFPKARHLVGKIVGRDTEELTHSEVIRAAVESVAENIVDGVVAPLFYAFIGGAPLAFAYRAINTLDSMVGYKNEQYINFGWASARLDDLANLVPARISLILISIAAWLCGKSPIQVWRIVLRDRKNHDSPNSGIAEAAVAGAMNIRLGGINYYQGKPDFKGYFGDPSNKLSVIHIEETRRMVWLASSLMVFLGVFCIYFLFLISSLNR